MNKIVELFGYSVFDPRVDWQQVISSQVCGFSGRVCYKTRKSSPHISIGTCAVNFGAGQVDPIAICPVRLTQYGKIFTDCLHLLAYHEPGNEFHLVPEVTIPGGSVDYFLVSVKNGTVADFVGIEIQTLDTTGTVWPERQRLLALLNVPRSDNAEFSRSPYGMNWKMTAKTILMQMHHKVNTFEHLNKKLVLVVQDRLLSYMSQEFRFDHLRSTASLADSMHIHGYKIQANQTAGFDLNLACRLSTDADGISRCLDQQAEARVEMEMILSSLQRKISRATLFKLF